MRSTCTIESGIFVVVWVMLWVGKEWLIILNEYLGSKICHRNLKPLSGGLYLQGTNWYMKGIYHTFSTGVISLPGNKNWFLRDQKNLKCHNGLWPSKGAQHVNRYTVHLWYYNFMGGGNYEKMHKYLLKEDIMKKKVQKCCTLRRKIHFLV